MTTEQAILHIRYTREDLSYPELYTRCLRYLDSAEQKREVAPTVLRLVEQGKLVAHPTDFSGATATLFRRPL